MINLRKARGGNPRPKLKIKSMNRLYVPAGTELYRLAGSEV
jgi:hypothetical protein